LKTLKTRKNGKNSIFVDALQSILRSKKSKSKSFAFNTLDPVKKVQIRQSSMLEAHITCGNELSKLPRIIEKDYRSVKIDLNYKKLFINTHEKVFGYNLLISENLSPVTDGPKKIKQAFKRLYKKKRSESIDILKKRLFENPCVLKLSKCRFRDVDTYVTIYYDILNDLFAVVDSKNHLIDFTLTNEVDYVDLFR
jgi:hypothetical protein